MSRPPRPVPALGSAPFRGSVAVRAGTITRHQLAGPGWVRLFPDVYVAAGVVVTHELRARAALVLFPDAVVCGRSAARLWGVDVDGPAGAPDTAEVEVVRPRRAPADGVRRPAGQQRIPGLRVRRCRVLLRDVVARCGLRVTTPTATALDLAAELAHDDAVVVLDQFCQAGSRHRRITDLDRLRQLADARTGRGCRRARAALVDADGLAESPQETRTRLHLHRSTLPRPLAQHRVLDGARREVARVDFAWPALRLALEYDGEGHLTRLGPDRQRMNRLQAAGWRVLYVTAADLHHPERLVAAVARALAERVAAASAH